MSALDVHCADGAIPAEKRPREAKNSATFSLRAPGIGHQFIWRFV